MPDFRPFVLTGLMLVSLLAAFLPQVGWAAPDQDPQRQTVPTPPPTAMPGTVVPPQPGPTRSSLPTPTASPSAFLPLPAAKPVLSPPVPATTPVLTAPGTTATAPLPLTLLPAPVAKTPTMTRRCQSVEQTASPLRSIEFELLAPCRVLVQVPAQAVQEDILLRLAPRLLTDAPPAEAQLQMRSVALTLDALSMGGRSLPGFIFDRPYTVTIRYNQTDLAIGESRADQLTIAYYNTAVRQWIPLHSQVDPKERLVSAEFDQPGWLALMLVLSPVEGASTPLPPATHHTPHTTTIAPSVPWPWNQRKEADNRMYFLGMVGAPFLLALAARLYVARRRQRRG